MVIDRQARQPNRLPTVAVIGCGYWGKNLVRNFNALGALAAVCDTTRSGRERAAELAPGVEVIDDLDIVLNSTTDAVVVATPAITHYQLTLRALEAGKDVFVEKPLALTAAEGMQLVALATRQKQILMVGHVLEYHPAITAIRRMVDENSLGKIQYIYSNRLSLGKVRREENILWSFAPHDVAIILRLMGTMPFQVVACGGSYLQPNIADVTLTHLLFDNGVRAHIHVSWLHPFKEHRLVIIGDRQMVSFDDVKKELLAYDQRPNLSDGSAHPSVRGRKVPFPPDEPLRIECQAFLSAVTSRIAPLTDGPSAVRVLGVLQAAQRSMIMNGEPVTLPELAFSADPS